MRIKFFGLVVLLITVASTWSDAVAIDAAASDMATDLNSDEVMGSSKRNKSRSAFAVVNTCPVNGEQENCNIDLKEQRHRRGG